jgi:DNA-binding NarL/FixJ family response regulator
MLEFRPKVPVEDTVGGADWSRMTEASRVRVFLVDDHEVVRHGVRSLIDASGDLEVVGEADSVETGLARVLAVQPDVAILDVRLPDGNGVELCREIRSRMPEVKCLMLTSYSDDEALFEAIIAGASGYVLKQVRGTELLAAVRRIASGEHLRDPAVTGRDAPAEQPVERGPSHGLAHGPRAGSARAHR